MIALPGRLLKWIRSWFHNPYDRKVALGYRLLDPAGKPLDTDVRLVSVSRHGLMQQGITCPSCGQLAASTGRYDLIHQAIFGEVINCPFRKCGTVLLASPDDDVDPVKPGALYDENIYHTFARSANSRPKQRVTSDAPVAGSWVVIVSDTKRLFVEAPTAAAQSFLGEEGRVEQVSEDGIATVAMSGNHGLGGDANTQGLGGSHVLFPVADVAPMITPSLRVGDRVSILRGPDAGKCGTVAAIFRGKLTLAITPDQVIPDVPLERVEKLVLNERMY